MGRSPTAPRKSSVAAPPSSLPPPHQINCVDRALAGSLKRTLDTVSCVSLSLALHSQPKHAIMPGTWYTSRAIFTDLVQDERKDKTYDESETVRMSHIRTIKTAYFLSNM